MRLATCLAVAAVVVATYSIQVSADIVVIHDESFTPGTWDVLVLGGTNVSGATITREIGGGVTGNAQRTNIFGSGSYTFDVAHFKTDRPWVPGVDGVANTIEWEAWYRVQNANEFAGFQLVARQGGSTYRAANTYFEPAQFTSTWQKRPNGLSSIDATDFSKFTGSGPSQLDFSPTAPDIEFGYMLSRGIFRSGGTTYRASFFDLQIDATPVPEPTSWVWLPTLFLFCIRRPRMR